MDVQRVTDLTAEGGQLVHIPIVGHTVCAGFPSPADDFLEGELGLPRWLVPVPPASFLVNVAGNSMLGAGIFDRDLALVDRILSAEHDRVVVAIVDGALSIKRYVIDGNVARPLDDRSFPTGELGIRSGPPRSKVRTPSPPGSTQASHATPLAIRAVRGIPQRRARCGGWPCRGRRSFDRAGHVPLL